jgi:hypothetical protein
MNLVKNVAGRESARGWLVLNLRGLDLENVTELRVDLDVVETMESRQAESSRLFDSLRRSLPEDEGSGEG